MQLELPASSRSLEQTQRYHDTKSRNYEIPMIGALGRCLAKLPKGSASVDNITPLVQLSLMLMMCLDCLRVPMLKELPDHRVPDAVCIQFEPTQEKGRARHRRDRTRRETTGRSLTVPYQLSVDRGTAHHKRLRWRAT
nr:hypothetical protein CFP56_76488 [Quercus suber]